MKNRRIEISIGKTINLGDFESIKTQVGMSQDIQDKDGLEEEFDRIYEDVEIKLNEYCDQLEKEHSNKNKRLRK